MSKFINKIKKMILKSKSNLAVVKYYKKVEFVPTDFEELVGDQLIYIKRIGEFEINYIMGNLCFRLDSQRINIDSWEGKCYLAEIRGLAISVLEYFKNTRKTEDVYFKNRVNHNWDVLDSTVVTPERIEVAVSIINDYRFQYNQSFDLFRKELALKSLIREVEDILRWN